MGWRLPASQPASIASLSSSRSVWSRYRWPPRTTLLRSSGLAELPKKGAREQLVDLQTAIVVLLEAVRIEKVPDLAQRRVACRRAEPVLTVGVGMPAASSVASPPVEDEAVIEPELRAEHLTLQRKHLRVRVCPQRREWDGKEGAAWLAQGRRSTHRR